MEHNQKLEKTSSPSLISAITNLPFGSEYTDINFKDNIEFGLQVPLECYAPFQKRIFPPNSESKGTSSSFSEKVS